jgi:hypothetical protein
VVKVTGIGIGHGAALGLNILPTGSSRLPTHSATRAAGWTPPTAWPSSKTCALCAARSPTWRLSPPEHLSSALADTLSEICHQLKIASEESDKPRVIKRVRHSS